MFRQGLQSSQILFVSVNLEWFLPVSRPLETTRAGRCHRKYGRNLAEVQMNDARSAAESCRYIFLYHVGNKPGKVQC